MGLGNLFHRGTEWTATDVDTGSTSSWYASGGLHVEGESRAGFSGGMGIPGAARCALLLSDLLAGLPWEAYRQRPGTTDELVQPTPSFLSQPSPPDVRSVTFGSMALDYLWHGNAVALVAARDRSGWPTAVLPIPADQVYVARAVPNDGSNLESGAITYQIAGRHYAHHDVVHVKGPTRTGELRGMGVLENHLDGALALAQEQARQARGLSGTGVPSGVLTVEDSPEAPLEQDEADGIKAKWMLSQRTRTVAVVPASVKFEPLAWNPTDLQLLEARQHSLHEVALAFGLDPSWLGISGSSMTYSNITQRAVDLVKFSLGGHLARWEQTLTAHMPRGTVARANLDELLRGDTLTRYQAHALALDRWLTVDEIRQDERRAPLTPTQRDAMRPSAPPAPAASTDEGDEPPADETPDEETTP